MVNREEAMGVCMPTWANDYMCEKGADEEVSMHGLALSQGDACIISYACIKIHLL